MLQTQRTDAPVRPISYDTSVPSRSCIQRITDHIVTQNGQGTAATNDAGTEQSVFISFAATIYSFSPPLLMHLN